MLAMVMLVLPDDVGSDSSPWYLATVSSRLLSLNLHVSNQVLHWAVQRMTPEGDRVS